MKSGACDSLVPAGVGLAAGRAKLFGAVDSAIEHGNRTQRDRELGQSDLFGGGDDGSLSIIRLPDSAPWTEMELLSHEKDALGLYLSGHPIDRHAENLRAFGAKTVGDLTMTEIPQSTDGVARPPDHRGRLRRRHRRRLPRPEDQEGRSDVRVHARGSPGRRRGRRVSRRCSAGIAR